MNYLIILVIIGMLILIHELGHFLAAQMVGIPIKRFSIGFGPKIWKFKSGETEYWLSLILLGGYLLPSIEDENEFFQIPICKRVLFTIGGPVANIVFPLFLFAILNVVESGFSLNGIFIKPFSQTIGFLNHLLYSIPHLLSQPDQISGVVGIISQGGQFIGADMLKVMDFSILISLNLAVFNLLPIPGLDGGKLILYLLERMHPKLLKLQVPLTIAGLICIIGLMTYATILDVGRLFVS